MRSLHAITAKRLGALFAGCALAAGSFAAPGAPIGPMVELLREPEHSVITEPQPAFSWIVNDARRGAQQSAYRIRIASRAELLAEGGPDVWDSGRVESSASTMVRMAADRLRPQQVYWWQVCTWDSAGTVSPFSAPQRFQTGEFNPARVWPAESRWVRSPSASDTLVLEDRPSPAYIDLAPVSVRTVGRGRVVADFGRTAFATLEVTLTSPRDGAAVVVHLGERALVDGSVDRHPGGTVGYQRLELTLERGTHTYLLEVPRKKKNQPHTQLLPTDMPEVCPFRVAEIETGAAEIVVVTLRQRALLYPFADGESSFRSSSRALDAVYELCKHTLRVAPFMAMYVDGTRERMPYEADAYIAQLSHYALDRDYAAARYTWEFLLHHASWPTEWSQHLVLMAWADYEQTGDARPLARFYPELQAKTLAVLEDETGLISTRKGRVTPAFLASIHYSGEDFQDIVDWPAGTEEGATKERRNGSPFPEGERDGFVFCDYNAVVNAFYYRNLVLMARIAEVIGKPDDTVAYREHAARVKERYNATFFRPQYGNVYVDGNTTRHASLHANLFALAFGLVPAEAASDVRRFIQGRGMACGPYPAQFLLEALVDHDAADYAVQLVTADSDRGWLNMIRAGATTTAEAWDFKYKRNLGWTHAWGAAPANIVARKLLGVEPLAPAFAEIAIRPQIGALAQAGGRVPTIRGPVEVAWERCARGYQCTVSIPANTQAVLALPGSDATAFTEGGEPASCAEGVTAVRADGDRTLFTIGAGTYTFVCSAEP
jgi:alpha-L-rhamnosidase